MEKTQLLRYLMEWARKDGLTFIEVHPVAALIVREEIVDEEDLQTVYRSFVKEFKGEE